MFGCVKVCWTSREHTQSHPNTVSWLCHFLVGRQTFSPEVLCALRTPGKLSDIFYWGEAFIRTCTLSYQAQIGVVVLGALGTVLVVPIILLLMMQSTSTCNAIFIFLFTLIWQKMCKIVILFILAVAVDVHPSSHCQMEGSWGAVFSLCFYDLTVCSIRLLIVLKHSRKVSRECVVDLKAVNSELLSPAEPRCLH